MKRFLSISFFILCVHSLFAQDSTRQNLGPNINTKFDDIGPIISPDGRTLYYVIEGHPSNTKSQYYNDAEDIWYSELDSNNVWTKAKRMTSPFNTRRYNSIEAISADGNIVYIRGAYQNGEYTGSGFSYVIKTNSGWSEPQEMNISEYSSMSKGKYSALWICPDGKTLILSFSKYGNSGGKVDKRKLNDIYVCFKIGPNTWAKPMYLKSINTKKYTESTPFMASDNTTLYFSSNRQGGAGDRDIWMTQRLDNTWQKWSEPVNLDRNINTSGWDAYYTVDAKGEYAYMVSDKRSYGLSDIVRIKLSEENRPNPVVLISGKVLNAKTKEPISARITYNSLITGEEIGQAISDPKTGVYKMTLPYGIQYSFSAHGSNFIPESSHLDLTGIAAYKEMNRDLYLVPIEVGQTVLLNNIFFESNKTTLNTDSFAELDRLVLILQDNAHMTIEIDGHTDNGGAPESNMTLSVDRANAVKDYLIKKGIAASRITTKGFGGTKPITLEDTEEAKQLNRRVEFIILGL
jgi:OmpA-OmpF porin, OOP family